MNVCLHSNIKYTISWKKQRLSDHLRSSTQKTDQSQSALAVAEKRSQVTVVAELDAPRKEPWKKR